MITELPDSKDNVLGFAATGDVTKADYEVLTPAVEAAIEKYGSAAIVCDLTKFHWEKVDAWGSDFSFGHEFHDKITKMAIVGDRKWMDALTTVVRPFYAQDAKYFTSISEAWEWVKN